MLNKIFITGALSFCVGLIHAAKEIELKVSVPADTYLAVEDWLARNAQYIGKSEQKEWYVTHVNDAWDYNLGFKDSLKTMRVRQEKKGDSFCYKYRHLDPITKKTTHRDEYEIQIDNGDTMLTILKLLGYTELTLVEKKRITYIVDDIFEVVLDDVSNVGRFIEVELKEPTDEVKLGIQKIEAILKKIGIFEFKQYDRGYIHMIWNPGYEFGVLRSL